jgi:hypothetical protein
MIAPQPKPLAEITQEAIKVLFQTLGIVNIVLTEGIFTKLRRLKRLLQAKKRHA